MRSTRVIGSNLASSAPPALGWQSVFILGDNLGLTLLLPNDMRYFKDDTDTAVALRLKWHTIVVNP